MLKTEDGKYLIFMCSTIKINIPVMEGHSMNPASLDFSPLVIISNHLLWVSMDISKKKYIYIYIVKILYSPCPGNHNHLAT